MRLLTSAALVALVSLSATAADQAPSAIRADALLDHIRLLSADDMRGRGNGSPELIRAGDYVADQFRAAGLEPGGGDGGWFQSFDLVAGLTVGQGNQVTIRNKGRAITLSLGASYYPMAAPASDVTDGPSANLEELPVVFAGYGLAVPTAGYDDYARVDVSGKAVLIFSHEPQEQNTSSLMNGSRPVPQTTLQAKASLARQKGAKVLLVVGDPSHRTDQADYGLFAADPDAEDHGIPVLRVRRTELQPLLDAFDLDAIARMIDADLVPRSRELTGAVVGVLRGHDPALAREAVVIGAHYDHVGIGGRLSVSPDRTGEIHNGADDNASGTASVIEIARAAIGQRARVARSLVFVAFAGEERGLLGSAHYVAEPAMPIADTVAMLNLDMVGRSRGSVDVSGLDDAPSIEADLSSAVTATAPIRIRRQGPGAGRSDDWNFHARRVPAINFFTGFHDDYHRPSDDWDKIDAAGTQRVAALALELAGRLASRPDRPVFVAR
jgi:hypothetical protein